MTCIVAVSDGERVLIGGDSAATTADGKEVYTLPELKKVFPTGPYAVGFTKSYRAGQILRYRVTWPEPPTDGRDLEAFVVTDVVDAVRQGLKSGGWQRTEDGIEIGGQFVLGLGSEIYVVHQDFTVARASFAAVGAGRLPAYGSLSTTEGLGMTLAERARAALEAAQRYTPGVREPFAFVTSSAREPQAAWWRDDTAGG